MKSNKKNLQFKILSRGEKFSQNIKINTTKKKKKSVWKKKKSKIINCLNNLKY